MFDKIKKNIYAGRYEIALLVIVAIGVAVAVWGKEHLELFEDRERFEQFVAGFGFWGPLVIILSIVLEVVIAPIPGFVPAITAGFLFGPIEGAIYSYIGNIIGTLIVFFLARKFGRPLIERFFKKRRLVKYSKIINRHENYLLFFYFFPILPIDVISAAFGLSRIRFKKFLVVILLGFAIYSLAITNFGDYLAKIWF